MQVESTNILMVDDDPGDCRLVEQFLKKSSQTTEFTIRTVQSLTDCLECLKNCSFDLVLLDLGLPDSSGIEVVQKVQNANPNIPIVVLTGLADEQIGLDAIKKGAEDYLVKGESLKYTLVRSIQYAIERKRAKKLKNEAEAKSRFVSTVSHELRTPLTSMKGGVAILLNGTIGEINNKQKELMDIIKRNIDRLGRLINDVLYFQKLECSKMVFDMRENDINKVVKEVEQTMLAPANEKGLNLVTDCDHTLPKITFDRDKIIQVVANIVANAIKFTDKGGITVAANKAGDNIIRVSVKDTGSGIKKEDMPRLFDEFEQLQDINDRKTGGTGLGLAISKEIIEKHNGKIWAESQFGKGTTISFVLPIKDEEIGSSEKISTVVDDTSDILEIAGFRLK
ncbi:MAG: ATP-binding response regulator [Planctomycetota bacterium]|jgi:signal transduction histidine kinase